jgi:single-strand DNA-binding protein
MSSFKLSGVIKVIEPTQQVSEKFSKRNLVVSDLSDAKYPQDILLEFTQDKTALLDTFMEGQEVEVSFGLKGREWTSPTGDVKYFNTLQAFRIEKVGEMSAVSVSSTPAPVADDSLPF